MLKGPTTFVVGAGASASYGLPVASKLALQAAQLAPHDPVYQLVGHIAPGRHAALNAVLNDFRAHPWPSLDAFIERRQQHEQTVTIGKMLLATLMGQAMFDPNVAAAGAAVDDDWLRYIVDFMTDGAAAAKAFAEGNAATTFITFNFDTMIEQGIRRLINSIYAGDAVEHVNAACQVLKVIHVHGVLGKPGDGGMLIGHGYLNQGWVDWAIAAAPAVHVIMDEIQPSILEASRNAIAASHILCFLGFGFDNENVAKLGLPGAIASGVFVRAFASAFKLSPAKRARLTDRLGPLSLTLGGEDDRCLSLLKNHDILRD